MADTLNTALNIPAVANLMADPARAKMLWTLIDGTMRPAGELAFAANVSPQSASAHLTKLVEGGLLLSEAQGRHRYFKIASTEAANLIENMASFGASIQAKTPRSPPLLKTMPSQFLHARTCYDHLAGDMAVKVLQAMLKSAWLVSEGQDFALTPLGKEKLAALDIEVQSEIKGRRLFARSCVDLTQRRPHLAGVLGAALLDLYVRDGWILRTTQSRVVNITPKGHDAFKYILGVRD
ncbi:DNA-binding transcriptional ArsR family regulator [Undibacterium sp. GrIS 1.2]|uniref:ArsR/SmtB family transcription factor n=1 Tax=Undibacterium sp. GrIS 1.2 TaxID=3143933 RepID=UPI003391B38D